MRRFYAVVLGLVCAAVTLPATQASAACVSFTGGEIIAQVYWPVRADLVTPGTISVTPMDCIPDSDS